MPQNSIKKDYLLVVLDHFSYKNGPIDLVWAFFQAKTSQTLHSVHLQVFVYRFGSIGGGVPRCPKTA
jgi:hypothetical protein